MDGVWHKRSWGGSVENVSVLVAIGVDDTGHREVIGVAEGMKEDKASWEQFIRSMIERGLKGVRLVVGDRCAGLVATVGEMLPQADTSVHGPLHAQRALQGAAHPPRMGVRRAQGDLRHGITRVRPRQGRGGRPRDGVQETESGGLLPEGRYRQTTTYLLDEYPPEHRRRIRTNNMIERLNREIRRRTRVVGSFPDGRSALMLICARIRYVTANDWSSRRYLDMSRLDGIMQSTD